MWSTLLFFIIFGLCQTGGEEKVPSVFISILVRNKAHTLPYFLTALYNLDYPKERIILYIRSQNNDDDSLKILDEWLEDIIPKKEYHDVIKEFYPCEGSCLLEGEDSAVGWFEEKFTHIMNLRQQSLNMARFSFADYYWSLDADVFLTDRNVLKFLIEENLPVVAPLLRTIGRYSNFWAGMTDSYYYLRTPEYSEILDRKKEGCFTVPMVHSSVLVNLRSMESDLITYSPQNLENYSGPHDDIIVFALSCTFNKIPLYVCNQHEFGMMMMPLDDDQDPKEDMEILEATLLEATVKGEIMTVDELFVSHLSPPPQRTKLGFDEIYMINLDRRPDRRERMEYNFLHLGLDFRHFSAIDGRELDSAYLEENGIEMLPGFSEPYHGRPLKMGEIGCFMSHYRLWQDIVSNNYDMVLIFEDDIKFEPYFIKKLESLLQELMEKRESWDLVFLGRKRTRDAEEPWLEGSNQLVKVDYTYWTLSYILSGAGARKLIDAEPLGKMLPVDEYLPIMYDRHPNNTWSSHFPTRNLNALSVEPLLVYPTHYTGEDGYISDTEATEIIEAESEAGGEDKPPCSSKDTCVKDEL